MIPPFDAREAFALSTEAGWNQTEGDWERLFRLAPEGCFSISADGRLAATVVALIYEPRLAWIGMMLTTPAHRGKGYARALIEQSLDSLEERGVTCVKLDATELGRPVYAKLGFADERPVSRWLRQPGECSLAPATGSRLEEWVIALDREAFGADRSGLLRSLAQGEVYAIEGKGFAFARPGRVARFFGPCVARDGETARTLLAAFLAKHGAEPTMLDLWDEHGDAVRLAAEAGYQPVRRLMRMLRGDTSAAHVASGPMIYTLAGFEYG